MEKLILLVVTIVAFSLSAVSAQTLETPAFKTISGGVLNGKASKLSVPTYPAAAQAVGAGGAVNVQVTIDEAGSVVAAKAVSGHPLLWQAAETAAYASHFNATTLSGQPVKVTGIIVYNFVGKTAAPDNETKLAVMGAAAFLTISKMISNEEWEPLTKEELSQTPQIAAEIMPLSAINKELSKEKRDEIIEDILSKLSVKLTGADAWQLNFGRLFGELFISLKDNFREPEKKLDERSVKLTLAKMNDLLYSAPPELPADVLGKLKRLTNYANVENLNSEENKSKFSQSIRDFFSSISPDLK